MSPRHVRFTVALNNWQCYVRLNQFLMLNTSHLYSMLEIKHYLQEDTSKQNNLQHIVHLHFNLDCTELVGITWNVVQVPRPAEESARPHQVRVDECRTGGDHLQPPGAERGCVQGRFAGRTFVPHEAVQSARDR